MDNSNNNEVKNQTFLQVLKFTLFSISAGIIQAGSYAILNELIKPFEGEFGPNYIIALLLSILWNFTFNRKYTFKSDGNVKKAMLLVLLFYVVFVPVSTILGSLATNSGWDNYLVLALSMLSNFVLEFLYTKYVVYREKSVK